MALFIANNGQLQTIKGIYYGMSEGEIKNMYIKNRLTEGVDFKRYEWLKGTDGCYIDTLINPAWNDQLSATAKVNGQPTDRWIFILTASGSESSIILSTNRWWVERNKPSVIVSQRGKGKTDNIEFTGFSATAEIYISLKVTNNATPTYSCKINGSAWPGTVAGSNIITTLPDTTYIIGDGTTGLDVLKLKNVKINSHNFIPCQLLKSISATLDANNVARNTGECGMYDSVSGKFYGNMSTTGTFTVEGEVEPETHTGLQQIYQNKLIEGVDYETYDWLKGDGTAYIDTKVTDLSISDYIKTIFDDSRNIGVHIRTWGRESIVGTNSRLVVGNDGYSTYIEVWGTNSSFRHNNGGIYVYDMYFDLLNNKVTINNQTYNLALPHGNGSSFPLFAKHASNASDFINVNLAKFKSFEIHNKINLVPCQLLRSIPRNLDAQCKERVAGECGMIDLISGKFYGNVANSGTFTVENDTENNE